MMTSGMTEAKFNETIDKVGSHYANIVSSHDATLNFDRNWSTATVNASAHQEGKIWTVTMYGGLARRPEITEDGFALVVCHELGHHLGGFPFKGERWASSEGQADYFSTHACARKIWADDLDINATFRATAPQIVLTQCNQAYSNTNEQNLCYRAAAAGKSLAGLLATLGHQGEPMYDTPDQHQVSKNDEAHPVGQCRLDTLFSGALCTKAFPDLAIPGRLSPSGQTSKMAENDASQVSCSDAVMISLGKRPRCWYAPRLSLVLDASHMTKTEIHGNGNGSWDPGETFGINLPLINNLQTAVSGAALSITGMAGSSSVNYPSIAPGSSASAVANVEGRFPESLRCGERFSLYPTVKVGKWQDRATLNFIFGHFLTEETQQETVGLGIPDKDPTGISRFLEASSTKTTNLIKLKTSITHSYIGDLKIVLKSPRGQEFLVQDHVSTHSGAAIPKTYDVEVHEEPIAGRWTLILSDWTSGDVGTLNSWGLEFTTSTCEAGISFVDAIH
jgi:subtilisin-like proprotein convertase family protein